MRVSMHRIDRVQHTRGVLSPVCEVYADKREVKGTRALNMRVWKMTKKVALSSVATPRCAGMS